MLLKMHDSLNIKTNDFGIGGVMELEVVLHLSILEMLRGWIGK